ncbi:hypothetical protein D9M68_533680 [compost metagenome]
MQFARQAGPFVFLRAHQLAGHQAQLGVGLAVVADVQREAAGGHAQDGHHGDAGDPGEHLADVGLRGGVDALQRLFHVVQVDAGAQHPAPALHHDHVTQLLLGLVGGGLFPKIVHGLALLAAAPGGRQQILDDGLALGVAQFPEVAAHQFRLAGVHEVLALQVIDEKVAVVPEFHLRQQVQRALAGGVVVGRGLQRRDGAVGQADVVAQFAFLAGQPGVFHHLLLALGQLQALHVDGDRNGGQGHQQGHRGQQQDFQAQLHRGFVSARICLLRRINRRTPQVTRKGAAADFTVFQELCCGALRSNT